MKVVREAEFSDLDVALLHAHILNEREIGPHGIAMSEAMDPKNQFAFIADEAPAVDWAAHALGRAQDRYYEANPTAKRHGHHWTVRRRR